MFLISPPQRMSSDWSCSAVILVASATIAFSMFRRGSRPSNLPMKYIVPNRDVVCAASWLNCFVSALMSTSRETATRQRTSLVLSAADAGPAPTRASTSGRRRVSLMAIHLESLRTQYCPDARAQTTALYGCSPWRERVRRRYPFFVLPPFFPLGHGNKSSPIVLIFPFPAADERLPDLLPRFADF